MTTPLQQQLANRGVDVAALVNAGFDKTRAAALLDGADATISEIRKIALEFRIPARSMITEISKSDRATFKLRENLKTKGAADYEVLDLLDRTEHLSELVSEKRRMRAVVAISTEEKNFEAAEEIAAFCRSEILKVDDLAPLIELDVLIDNGTSARLLTVNQRHLEGSVVSHFDHSFIFLSQRPDPRMRFTLAHELCHYLCDVSASGNAWFDEDTLNPTGGWRRDEIFANSFASALLLPPGGVGETLNAFRDRYKLRGANISDLEVMFLARFFGVSFQVAGRRLEDLKILPSGGGQSLYEAVVKKFKTPEIFAAESGLPPREQTDWLRSNRRLAREAHNSVAEGKASIGRLSELVELPVSELQGLVGQ